ncbi:MAG: glycerol-3-phosphate cytidylyltransferase [Granulosicoccus sp.]|jgi:cytidyltransferase-like protein
MKKRVMVDMSATLLHHGHVRLLAQAAEFGTVIVGLTGDEQVTLHKGYTPELNFEQRKEILLAIRWVDQVVETPWLIDELILDRHSVDLLVHGDDNTNKVDPSRLLILPRTVDISSTLLRKRAQVTLRCLKDFDEG